jgi:hypothetical protein
MARPQSINTFLKPCFAGSIPKSNPGSIGFDNPRENIDPHIKTQVVDSINLRKSGVEVVGVPIGGIILWSGEVVDIPAGFQLCDGTNGTPNLQDRFVLGAGSTYAVGATGGALSHNHNTTRVAVTAAGVTNVLVTIAASNHLPPYYALAYIQRLA